MKIRPLIVIALAIGISLAACEAKKKVANAGDNTSSLSQECPKDILCTMDYRTIGISVKNKSGQAVILDSTYTYIDDTNKTKIRDFKISTQYSPGQYILAEDNTMALVSKAGKNVIFLGFQNGQEVVRHTFLVGHDCCHIKLLSKSNEIVID